MMAKSSKKSKSPFEFIYLLFVVILLIGFFLGAQYQKNNNTQNKITKSNSVENNENSYISQDERYSLKYPSGWSFEQYKPNFNSEHYTSFTLFENMPPKEIQDMTIDERVNGEMNIVTIESLRGKQWTNISESEFFNINSEFWVTGSGIGGGPGFTYDTPEEISINGKRAIIQESHPDKAYEGVYPEQITRYYYLPLLNDKKEVLRVSYTYDSRSKDHNRNIKEFEQIFDTLTILK